jgi:hypothetical protein
MPADVLDLKTERLAKAASNMDDETLVFVMLGILQPSMSGHPVAAGASEKAGICARVVFTEIGSRWIPLDVFGAAMKQILDDEGADDA